MLPAFGRTKPVKKGICLLSIVAPSEQRVTVSQATHISDEGSHEDFCGSSTSHSCRRNQRIRNRCPGERGAPAARQTPRKAPRVPCPLSNPDTMAKGPRNPAWVPVHITGPVTRGCATSSFESKHAVPPQQWTLKRCCPRSASVIKDSTMHYSSSNLFSSFHSIMTYTTALLVLSTLVSLLATLTNYSFVLIPLFSRLPRNFPHASRSNV